MSEPTRQSIMSDGHAIIAAIEKLYMDLEILRGQENDHVLDQGRRDACALIDDVVTGVALGGKE